MFKNDDSYHFFVLKPEWRYQISFWTLFTLKEIKKKSSYTIIKNYNFRHSVQLLSTMAMFQILYIMQTSVEDIKNVLND